MARLQELLTQSTIQNLGLGEVLAVRAQEAQQLRQVMNEQAKAQVEAVKAAARGRRETGETLGALLGAGAGALMAKKGQRLEGAALGAGLGQAVGGQLSGAVREPGVTTGADIGIETLQKGLKQKELLKKKQAKEEKEEKKLEMEQEKFDFDKKMEQEKLELQKEELEFKKQQQIGKDTTKKLSENLKKQEDLEEKRVEIVNQARSVKSNSDSIDNVLSQIDDLFSDPRALRAAVGGSGLISRQIPGTKSRSIAGKVETVLANAAFTVLQDMREKSKTGGALGSISERELQQLERAIGNLDMGQSDEEFFKNLQKVRDRFVKIKNLSTDTFRELYGDEAYKQYIETEKTKRRKYNPKTGRLE